MNAPLNIDLTQILLHMLNFVILFGALTLILYKPVMKFLKERRAHYEELEKINKERTAECERLKAEYEEKLKSVDEKASEARREAEALAAENAKRYIEKAQIRAGEIVKAAEEEAEARKAHTLESAQTEIGELVLSAAQKLMNDSASRESDSALYDKFIDTASNGKNGDGGDE
ncbi:MAG: ATP synthase F0 subunit B [Clostridia bacterium]|nr:ATP synthase F0 subunit B [Clostridia bacterium]